MMGIRRFVLITLATLFLLAAGTAQAGEFGRRGAYVGLNAAYGFDLASDEFAQLAGVSVPVPLTYSDSWGLNARIGYRAANWLALELQYEWMDGIGIGVAGSSPIAIYEPHTLTGNLKFLLPIGRIQPYILAGGGLAIYSIDLLAPVPGVDASGTGFGFRGGAGLDLYLTENLVLNAEGTAVLNTSDLSVNQQTLSSPLQSIYYFSLSGGLTYRF